jgi:hypothetical protein
MRGEVEKRKNEELGAWFIDFVEFAFGGGVGFFE